VSSLQRLFPLALKKFPVGAVFVDFRFRHSLSVGHYKLAEGFFTKTEPGEDETSAESAGKREFLSHITLVN
jgi:hypothetical protein